MPSSSPLTISGRGLSSRGPLQTLHAPARSLYVHVPFCFHKCHYCDFYSFVDTQDRQGLFVDRLVSELRALAPHARPARDGGLDTVFVGGGTPSLLAVPLWERLLQEFHGVFALAPGAEFTVECNPETVTPELMQTLVRGGVTRVSMGAQSFESRHLKTLERWHDPQSVERALGIARDAGIARRSVDLIFGVPEQTPAEWRGDLTRALGLLGGQALEHISCYALTYEPNTAMTRRLELGDFEPMDEDVEAQMYRDTLAILRDAGLERYEVSNFARPGAECQHNLAYWRQDQWLAAGPSGSAHVGGQRWKNIPRLTDWMEGVEASGGYSPIVDFEGVDLSRAVRELVMTTVRLAEGMPVARVMSALDDAARDRLNAAAVPLESRGWLTRAPGAWRLTDEGFLFADGVAAELMSAIAG
jgi:oxygen-independent coproporphyrinogen III oxidase